MTPRWTWFLRLWRGQAAFGVFLVALTLLTTVVSMAVPLLFRFLIEALRSMGAGLDPARYADLRWRYVLLLLGVGVGRLVSGLYPGFRAWMNNYFERTIRQRYFHAMLDKDYRFFLAFRTGDLVTRLTDDIGGFPKVAWFACSGFFRALTSLGIVVACVATMVWMNPTLAAISVLPLPLAFVAFTVISRRLQVAHNENRTWVSKTTDHLESCLAGVRILKAYNAEPHEATRFESLLNRRYESELSVVRLQGAMSVFFGLLNQCSQILAVVVGGQMVIRGTLALGDYYAFFAYMGMIAHPMLDLPTLLVTSREAFVCVDRLEELREFGQEPAAASATASAVAPTEAPTEAPSGSPSGSPAPAPRVAIDRIETLTLDDVSFCYADGPCVLKDVSLEVRRGERVAVVGEIGSGKSTLINLVSGILRPTKGRILVNGVPLEQLDPVSWRARLGYIGQEPLVFSTTVAENIRFWRELERERIEAAARGAQLTNEIAEFPQGFEQEVGQRGVTLSGGQKQRLTIARALAGTPEVLVMDDVTASLDAENEEQFWNDLDRAAGDVTVLIVTHRLATARRADRVVVLREGALEAAGSLTEVEGASPTFRRVFRADALTGESACPA